MSFCSRNFLYLVYIINIKWIVYYQNISIPLQWKAICLLLKLEDLSTQEQDSMEIQSESEKKIEDFFPDFLDASENESSVTESFFHSAPPLYPLTISSVD